MEDNAWVAVAFDVPAGAYMEVSNATDLPNSSAGSTVHPEHSFITSTNWGCGVRGVVRQRVSWGETENVTQEMLDAHNSVMQAALAGTSMTYEYVDVDLNARTALCETVMPIDATLDWRTSPSPWAFTVPNMTSRATLMSGNHYICTTVIAPSWQDWTNDTKDIEPNGSLTIDRVAGASSVYLVFSDDVTTSSGATLSRGVTYSQTSPSLEVTAGSAGAFVVRVSG
tara:strand:+ start:1573 stop:2250 length:678 start_codon:yes stop_codon:yes gene_type:complete